MVGWFTGWWLPDLFVMSVDSFACPLSSTVCHCWASIRSESAANEEFVTERLLICRELITNVHSIYNLSQPTVTEAPSHNLILCCAHPRGDCLEEAEEAAELTRTVRKERVLVGASALLVFSNVVSWFLVLWDQEQGSWLVIKCRPPEWICIYYKFMRLQNMIYSTFHFILLYVVYEHHTANLIKTMYCLVLLLRLLDWCHTTQKR